MSNFSLILFYQIFRALSNFQNNKKKRGVGINPTPLSS
nr:MAG TPA: hypothetical protein [Herelleviridae sp.]